VTLAMSLKILWALLGTVGYATLCRLKRADVCLAASGGALAWATYSLTFAFLGTGVFSYFLAALCAGLFAEILGAARKRPATVYAVSALIALVPGGGMFYTLSAALNGDSQRASALGFETLLIAGLMAAGIAISSVGARLAAELSGARRAAAEKAKKE
jgi:uncharacterized membrane protein YjjB (DUF3815 family)